MLVPNGVHTALFQPRERDAELEASLGLRGKTVIGYAGGLVDYEGLDLLLVQDRTTGLGFEKGSATDLARALSELLDAPELRFKLGESARTWVTNERDWSSIVDIVDSTYREILA